MPRGDRTGPNGMGAMSGRAAGFCAGYGAPGFANPIPGRGMGFGMGRGFGGRGSGRGRGFGGGGWGWRNWGWGAPFAANQNLDQETEREALKNQADMLQADLESIKKRLTEIEAREQKDSE